MTLMLLSTILGFLGPFIPELLKGWNRKQDNTHELAMVKLQAEMAEKQQYWKMEESRHSASMQLDLAETKAIYSKPESFGVQVLDAARASGMPFWVIWPVFWAFALVDWLNASVRPAITYWIVGFYLFYKWSLLQLAKVRLNWQEAVVANWNDNDTAVLMLCLGYFFGQRAAKAAFGGNASTGRVGAG